MTWNRLNSSSLFVSIDALECLVRRGGESDASFLREDTMLVADREAAALVPGQWALGESGDCAECSVSYNGIAVNRLLNVPLEVLTALVPHVMPDCSRQVV